MEQTKQPKLAAQLIRAWDGIELSSQALVLTVGGACARFTCPLTVVYWAPAM